jgi:hypothetical protein
VPGPREPLYSSGARLEHFYPISAVVDGQGLNMTVQSYVGNLDFGFVSDRDLIPDLWRLVDLLQESMAEYLAAARAELGSEAEPAPATPPAPARRRKAAARKATKRSPATKRTAKTTAKKATARKTTARKTAATSAGRKAPAAPRAATKRSATKKRASAPS